MYHCISKYLQCTTYVHIEKIIIRTVLTFRNKLDASSGTNKEEDRRERICTEEDKYECLIVSASDKCIRRTCRCSTLYGLVPEDVYH